MDTYYCGKVRHFLLCQVQVYCCSLVGSLWFFRPVSYVVVGDQFVVFAFDVSVAGVPGEFDGACNASEVSLSPQVAGGSH